MAWGWVEALGQRAHARFATPSRCGSVPPCDVTGVSIMAVRAVIAGVEHSGEARDQVMSDAGLGPADLEDGLARVAWPKYCHVVRAALARSRDPALGLHMSERAVFGAFDV